SLARPRAARSGPAGPLPPAHAHPALRAAAAGPGHDRPATGPPGGRGARPGGRAASPRAAKPTHAPPPLSHRRGAPSGAPAPLLPAGGAPPRREPEGAGGGPPPGGRLQPAPPPGPRGRPGP